MSPDFANTVAAHGLDLRPTGIDTLQINITRLCNQTCVHCHVDASPRRREAMDDRTLDAVLKVLETHPEIKSLDITGGAPELHPRFREVVRRARQAGRHVMVRHNLTVTLDPHPVTKESMAYLPEFFAAEGVEVISSLPYYREYFTDKQRGDGVFQKSIASLKELNTRGFGVEGTGLLLHLVYNPVGPFLPAAQSSLEQDYKRELKAEFDISFNRLYALTNMPINRFKAQLKRLNGYDSYMARLVAAFNPQAAAGIMCRNTVSVGYDGTLYDCDFNQFLGMHCGTPEPWTIFSFDAEAFKHRTIKFAEHCFGCAAGAGSSCGGNTI